MFMPNTKSLIDLDFCLRYWTGYHLDCSLLGSYGVVKGGKMKRRCVGAGVKDRDGYNYCSRVNERE